MTLTELYQLQSEAGQAGNNARELLAQTHWFAVNVEFDPKTGDALPQPLSAFLTKIVSGKNVEVKHDRLYRITEHARPSILRLFRSLNENPRREHALLPVRAVRELDASSFIKLSTRPGRNIREKLAGKPYLQAVRRFQSVDLTENRLLKAFVTRLLEMLELRHKCLDEAEDELVVRIQSWLNTDDAHAISPWNNLPPNNTLLSHRDYRRIWDAWRWLQSLDDDIARDFSQLNDRQKTMQIWNQYAQMYREGTHYFADMPILFAYDDFKVEPWTSTPLTSKVKGKIKRFISCPSVTQPACIDLAYLHPQYATTTSNRQENRENYLWQEWSNEDETVAMGIFDSDAAHLHPNTTTISLPDLLFSHDDTYTEEHLDRAAQAFTNRLSKTFQPDQLLWLVPDTLNDFDLEIVRRNINARFPNAQPLPRSVAAVFEQVDYAKLNNGFAVLVIDTIGGATTATKLIARSDQKLKKQIPETKGFYWERCPTIILSRDKHQASQIDNLDMITVDADGKWHNKTQPLKPSFIDQQTLRHDSRIGQFSFVINISRSPVAGGVRLYDLQKQTEDIPLWRDQIPELSIKVMLNGRYQRFYLVSRGTTVVPVRGQSISIPVGSHFTLPAGKRFYQFPIFQGENEDETGYSARINSPAFPLKQDSECSLQLTFEYGADEPYKLVFTPIDKSFPPIRTTWQRTEEIIITDAPAPDYPQPMSWYDLQNWRDAQKNEVNLCKWLVDSLTRLLEMNGESHGMTVNSRWRSKIDKDGNIYWFSFANTNDRRNCYLNSKQFIQKSEDDPNELFPIGTLLYGKIREQKNGLSAYNISPNDLIPLSKEEKLRLLRFKERSLQNRMTLIWSNSLSINDRDCPGDFHQSIEVLTRCILAKIPPEVIEKKMLLLLSCMHKDAPDECIQWITEQVESGHIRDPRAVGFALGDISQKWQQYIFDQLVSHPNHSAISVFAYAIWREQHFVEKFTISNLTALLNSILNRLNNLTPTRVKNKWEKRDWVRAAAEPLELLLGLLRTRASDNTEIRMLLQPHQDITKKLAEQVDRVEEVITQSSASLFSRVQIDVKKPKDVRSSDLIYSLRLYLTGDDVANTIHITSISDDDND
ncbi:DNA-binding protein [Desulfatibacillum aliphaticivorans]|uniref:DNA-binding protein n=1 Tax=Desulfatibacillum aliphaticivorans TaxID=218208 RepID=UPI0012FBB4A2|nr:DNA-binding protein [Desulfatibacillum aliphaticivorans]